MSKNPLITPVFMFFGVENLIVPLVVGFNTGDYFCPAIFGFILTAVGLPLICTIGSALTKEFPKKY